MTDGETIRWAKEIAAEERSARVRAGASHYKVRAPFLIHGRWRWHTWETETPYKHAAVLEMAESLGADGWNFGQTDFYPSTDYPGGTF